MDVSLEIAMSIIRLPLKDSDADPLLSVAKGQSVSNSKSLMQALLVGLRTKLENKLLMHLTAHANSLLEAQGADGRTV